MSEPRLDPLRCDLMRICLRFGFAFTGVVLALIYSSSSAFGCSVWLQDRAGSIYAPDRGPIGPIADKTARRQGDLLTVIISEVQDIQNEEQTDLAKSTNLNYELASFNIDPDFFDVLPDLAANSSDQFSGQAQVAKRDSFEARLTAMVEDVLPNGNMILSGRREIRVQNQTKLIEFSGIVRKYDVTPLNTIRSELVAEARISYVGEGPTTNTTMRTGLGSMFHRFLDWLWPF
jgi:flagellar L-ring protein precursor FlgH